MDPENEDFAGNAPRIVCDFIHNPSDHSKTTVTERASLLPLRPRSIALGNGGLISRSFSRFCADPSCEERPFIEMRFVRLLSGEHEDPGGYSCFCSDR